MADLSTPRPWGAYERDSDPPANWSIRGADGMRVATHLYKKDALDIMKAIESHDRLLRVEKLAGELADSVDLMSAMRAYIMNPQAFDGDELKVQLRQAEAKIRKLLAEIGKGAELVAHEQ